MTTDATRAALDAMTTGDALDELTTEIDLTRLTAHRHGIDPDEANQQITAALRLALTYGSTAAEALQRVRGRWAQ